MSERADIVRILKDEDSYTHADWQPELNVEVAADALLSLALRIKAEAFNEGYNAATDAHGITT